MQRYLCFGYYPGAVALENDPDRWYAYMKDSIVDAVIGKDILQNRAVANPSLFRQAFEILCHYPAQEKRLFQSRLIHPLTLPFAQRFAVLGKVKVYLARDVADKPAAGVMLRGIKVPRTTQ